MSWYVIDEKKGKCKLGIFVTIKARAKWEKNMDGDGSFRFEVPYTASYGLAKISEVIDIPVSGNTKGKVGLVAGASATYEVTDWKVSEDHAHCHGKVVVNHLIGKCTLFDDDLDGDLPHVTIERYQAALDKAMS